MTAKPVTASWRDLAGDPIAFLHAVSAAAPHPLAISRWDLDKEIPNGMALRGTVEWARRSELVEARVDDANDQWLVTITPEGTRRAQLAPKAVSNS